MTTLAVPPAPSASPRGEALLQQWHALHEAAGLVAVLADETAAAALLQADDGAESLGRASGWRLALVGRGLADTAAILEGGIRALLVARARGAAVRPAAQALWQEFVAARAALLALAPPR